MLCFTPPPAPILTQSEREAFDEIVEMLSRESPPTRTYAAYLHTIVVNRVLRRSGADAPRGHHHCLRLSDISLFPL